MADLITDPTIMANERKLQLWRGFGVGLESVYRSEEAANHGKSIATNWLLGLFFFDLFVFNDYYASGALFPYYLICRLGICTPLTIALALVIRKSDKNCDLFASALPVVNAIPLSALLMFGHGSYHTDYLYGDILLMVSGVMLSHSRFPSAVGSVALQCLCIEAVVQGSRGINTESSIVANLYCLSAASVALISAAFLDLSNRRAFLLRLHVSRLNKELEEMALKDPLTGLGNRRCLETAAAGLWGEGSGPPRQVSFILLDVDCFKLFNDSYGHPAGDLCLQAIARCVARNTRSSDVVIRFGGEELVVFMPDTDLPSALDFAERIRRAITREAIGHPALGIGAVVTASLGVACALTTACTLQQLVARADTALYEAKNKGRNRVWPKPIAALEVELAD